LKDEGQKKKKLKRIRIFPWGKTEREEQGSGGGGGGEGKIAVVGPRDKQDGESWGVRKKWGEASYEVIKIEGHRTACVVKVGRLKTQRKGGSNRP